MLARTVFLLAVPLAAAGWWALYRVMGTFAPEQPGAVPLFFVLLFLTLIATLAPLAAYLNRRFAPGATARNRMRYLRHSALTALCLSSWAWLQTHRAFNVGFAFIIALIFVAIEALIARMRGELRGSDGDEVVDEHPRRTP